MDLVLLIDNNPGAHLRWVAFRRYRGEAALLHRWRWWRRRRQTLHGYGWDL